MAIPEFFSAFSSSRMDRRSFLKSIGVALAALSVPAVAERVVCAGDRFGKTYVSPLWREFNPELSYGNAVELSGPLTESQAVVVAELVMNDARHCLPPGTPFTVVEKTPMETPEFVPQRRHLMYWKYEPKMRADPANWYRA